MIKKFHRDACMDESHWVTPHWHEVDGPEMIRRIESDNFEDSEWERKSDEN